MRSITPPERSIIAPLRISKAVNSDFPSFLHFLFIPINEVENKYIAPNRLAESIIELEMINSGTLLLHFLFLASDVVRKAFDITSAELIPKSLKELLFLFETLSVFSLRKQSIGKSD